MCVCVYVGLFVTGACVCVCVWRGGGELQGEGRQMMPFGCRAHRYIFVARQDCLVACQ